MTQRVFVDANVLFSRTTRDWLFLLRNGTDSMFQVHSTEDVLAEVIHSLRRQHPDWDGGHITRLRNTLVQNLDEIIDEFDGSIQYNGADPDDRHVHAGATASRADILLTADAGFAKLAAADELPYSVYGCDAFFMLVNSSMPTAVLECTLQQMRYWRGRPPIGAPQRSMAGALVAADCAEFATVVDEHLRTLSRPNRP